MKHLAPQDRPREKLQRAGVDALGDNELLAVLIGHGGAGSPALTTAEAVLAFSSGVQGLPKLHRGQLQQVAGIGPAQACRILAGVELGRRTLTLPERDRPRFLTPEDAGTYLLPRFGAHAVERFGVLLLDTRYRLLGTRVISIGSINESLAHPREVFREALLAGSPVVVAFHNHPSGDPTPSRDDIELTRRLQLAGEVLGVALLDHIVLGDARFCSMRGMSLM